MENSTNSKSLIINYGIYLGVATVLISLITYALGTHLDPHWSISLVSGILFIGLIVFGIKKYKETNEGFLTWGQGVKIGVGIAIVAALIGTIYNYLFMIIFFVELTLVSPSTKYKKYIPSFKCSTLISLIVFDMFPE